MWAKGAVLCVTIVAPVAMAIAGGRTWSGGSEECKPPAGCGVVASCCRSADSAVTESTDGAVPDGVAAKDRPTCCAKKAYCCRLNRECCRRNAPAATVATVSSPGTSSEVGRGTCCAKYADCCETREPCCGRKAAFEVPADATSGVTDVVAVR